MHPPVNVLIAGAQIIGPAEAPLLAPLLPPLPEVLIPLLGAFFGLPAAAQAPEH